MATADEYASWIVKNAAKRGTPEFDTVAQAYQLAKSDENLVTAQAQQAPIPQEPGIGQQLLGAGETALTLATGATGGALGMVAGAGAGLAQQILGGQFGTPEAVKAVEQAAMKGSQALTYQPRTQAGQAQTQAVGQFLGEALPPILPALAAPGMAMQAARTAAPTLGAIGQVAGAAGQRAATATGRAIARPVQAAATGVREMVGMETPAPAAAVAVPRAGQIAELPVGQSKTATLFDDWVQKSREQDPQTKDVFSNISQRAQAAPDVDFELRMVRTSDAIPTQLGDDYLNASSMNTAQKIATSKSIRNVDRVEDVLPIRLDENMRVIDGNHRHAAAVLNKDEYIQALVPIGKGSGKVVNLDAIRQGAPIAAAAAPTSGAGRVSIGAAATPEALRRVTTAEGLRVPIPLTRGAATREAGQLAFEKEQMKGEFGAPLRNRAEENNLQVLQNFDAAIDATGAQAAFAGPAATGSSVVNALSGGYQAAKNKTNVAYTTAKKSPEAQAPVDTNTVVTIGRGDQEITNSLLGYINGKITGLPSSVVPDTARKLLIKLDLADADEAGNLIAKPATVGKLEEFRKELSGTAKFDDAVGLREETILKKLIDAQTEPVAGPLYKQARALRTEQARKFENRAIVARLIKNRKGMEDPQVAVDQVFQRSVLSGSPEELTFLKRVLLTSGPDGQQAWKELQAATVQHIRDQSTSGVGTDSAGRALVSPAKLNQIVNQLDKNGRLDVVFGKQEAQRMRDLNEVVKYVTTVPPGTLINSSGTAATLMAAMAEAGATGAATGIPLPIYAGIKQIVKMRKEGRTKAKINEALNALPATQP
jgi:hypothetical protein